MSNTKSTKRTAKAAASSIKRAVIYVRVSSERQADKDKVSPEAQEADCRALAQWKGYQVVAVYRDTAKYRLGKKMVEPSGTRADRPQLRAMLADARAGAFDVILAWREDRLYRSYRPMLDVLECIEETGIEIELAKETFDKRMMGGKVWVAKMELDAKHDRFSMGVAGRLAQGKAWNGVQPYGYKRVDGFLVEHQDEAQWVRLIWRWYGEGASMGEIRQRLIAGNAKQKGQRAKYPWSLMVIKKILAHDYYHTGTFQFSWDGKPYTLPVPVIIDADTAAAVRERKAKYVAYPAGNLKVETLVAGLVYCEACDTRMRVTLHHSGGEKTKYSYYRCINNAQELNHVLGCAKSIRTYKIDDDVWQKVWNKISVPGELEAAIKARVTELQAQEFDASAECAKLQKRLDDLAMKRQELIAWAQDKIITEADLALRLTSISFEQAEAERELRDKSLLIGNRAERLLKVARAYREGVVGGAVDVTKNPESAEEAARVWQFKKTMVEGLVTRVDVKADKSTRVTTIWDFSKAALPVDLQVTDGSNCSRSWAPCLQTARRPRHPCPA